MPRPRPLRQVRVELSFAALDPKIKSIVPWRDPAFYTRFQGRPDLLAYAASKGVPVVQTAAKPYSMDENMMHISYEAGILEDPANPAPADMFRMTVDPRKGAAAGAQVALAQAQAKCPSLPLPACLLPPCSP